ncbi:DeoR family transcriptional regulator [Duganella sp. FT92W]|uniref:DeoR family transcriptional regulator n=1 Tax=Pseudoduganella rivuli TaxID=2666085 RepID=A0A7X2II58_9BURK|nr:DeoR/GlpR family DNA-binding transcription regulator [Pseudoduganella rivuli]MRV70265.1 DeoR family transcriptional regulator [Pseudoduganella rivuli]
MLNDEQRRGQILDVLRQQGSLRVSRLAQRFGVTPVTIRTDLRALADAGLLLRQHGCARLPHMPPPEANLAEKRTLHRERKLRIAASAAALVAAQDKIILDAGSSTLILAQQLHAAGTLTVFTNSLPIAAELAQSPAIELIVAGGVLRHASQSLQGRQAEASLDGYVFDKLFLGADGIDMAFGLSTHDALDASLNARMIAGARRVIVLADSSKFGRICLHRIGALEHIHTIVTDASMSSAMRDAIRARGIELIVAGDTGHAH